MKYLHKFETEQEFKEEYDDRAPHVTAISVSGYTNLMFVGGGQGGDDSVWTCSGDSSVTFYTMYRNPKVGYWAYDGNGYGARITAVQTDGNDPKYLEPWVSLTEKQSYLLTFGVQSTNEEWELVGNFEINTEN